MMKTREGESMERYKKAREKRKGEGQGLSVMILASKVGDITDERNKNLMMSKTLGSPLIVGGVDKEPLDMSDRE